MTPGKTGNEDAQPHQVTHGSLERQAFLTVAVVKWSNTSVCKTDIHEFESH